MVLVLVLVLLLAVWCWLHVVRVPYKHVMIVDRLGSGRRVVEAGLAFLSPLDVVQRFSWVSGAGKFVPHNMQLCYDCPTWTCRARDGVEVGIDTVLYYAITDATKAADAYADPIKTMADLVHTTVVEAVRYLEVERLSTTELQDRLPGLALEQFAQEAGVRIGKVRIQRVDVPEGIRDATTQQVAARLETQTKQQRLRAEHDTDTLHLKHRRATQAQEHALAIEATNHALALGRLRAAGEAQALAGLLPVFDQAAGRRGTLALLSQYLGGQALGHVLRAARVPVVLPQKSVELALALPAALHFESATTLVSPSSPK